MPRTLHPELHRTARIGWLRVAVLGALAMGLTAGVGKLFGAVV